MSALQLHSTSLRLIDMRTGSMRFGCKRGKWYSDIESGLMTRPVKVGSRFARWPEHEVEAILKARIAGADDEQVRQLVDWLMVKRREGHPFGCQV